MKATFNRYRAKYTVPSNNLVDKIGAPANGESYLDITEVEITFSDNLYVVRMTVNAPWPLKLDDPSIFLEWDLLVDVDPNYGWNEPHLFNETSPDFHLRLSLTNRKFIKGEFLISSLTDRIS